MLRNLLLFLLLIGLSNCSYTIKVKDGTTAHELKQYSRAIPMLQKDFERTKGRTDKGKIAYRIADSYMHLAQDEEALRWYQLAYENNYGPEALKGSAYQLKKLERYKEAGAAFKELGIEIGSPYEYRKELTACTVASGWKDEESNNGWSISTTNFNSPQNDFAPVPFSDGRIVFTSDRAISLGDKSYDWTGNKFNDLFIVEAEGASPQSFDPRLNTPEHEGPICFDSAYNEAFLVKTLPVEKGNKDIFCKIYVVQKDGDSWSTPRPLPFQKENINYLHPCLAPDGNTLYYSCNDPEGWGGYDLYETRRNPATEQGWTEPKILSRNINTNKNEFFPYMQADTLYFASDGHTGMGGLDIFKSYPLTERSWAPVQNLKAPINSGADDFAFLVTQQNKNATKVNSLILSGFFTSNRPGGSGGDDIYRFEKRVPPPAPPKVDTLPKQETEMHMYLEIYVLEKIFSKPNDPNSTVLGRKPLEGSSLTMDVNGKQEQLKETETPGLFKIELKPDLEYKFVAQKEQYLNNSNRFSSRGLRLSKQNPMQIFELEIVLDKKYINQEIVLENIYYDFDKWDIRQDAQPTLNKLAETLSQNPDIRIELGSHTDCRGGDDYNQSLSQKRAESAVAYLINQGIDSQRLKAQGYGESQPAASCVCNRCTEAEHQQNRRTTFKIIE
jgi:outer membrane protein OmpA-like peptidoglycan-associated protein